MVRQLSSEDFESFITEKHAAAVHFDAEWDVAHRPIARLKMQEAETVLSTQARFGEVDCGREPSLARSVPIVGIPAVAYYMDGMLSAVLIGAKQNVRARVERLLRGDVIGPGDGTEIV